MFNLFKNNKTVSDNYPEIKVISEIERKKKDSVKVAKQFAENISEDVYILRQFFDMKPKIGTFGKKNANDVTLTLQEDFIPGIKITFHIGADGVSGFEFTEI